MSEIDIFTLNANNSSGEQVLSLFPDDVEYNFRLSGKHNGQYIQIDFDAISKQVLEDIKAAIDLAIEQHNTMLRSAVPRE